MSHSRRASAGGFQPMRKRALNTERLRGRAADRATDRAGTGLPGVRRLLAQDRATRRVSSPLRGLRGFVAPLCPLRRAGAPKVRGRSPGLGGRFQTDREETRTRAVDKAGTGAEQGGNRALTHEVDV